MLEALQICGQTIEEHLHLLIPPIVKLLDSSDTPTTVKRFKQLLTVNLPININYFVV